MFAAIDPAHAFASGVRPVFNVERKVNLIANPFFRGPRLASLRPGRDRRCQYRSENHTKKKFTTEDTEARRTQNEWFRAVSVSSGSSVVKLIFHSQSPGE